MPGRRRSAWTDSQMNTEVAEGSAGLTTDLDGTLSVADSQGLTLTRLLIDLSFYSRVIAGAHGIQRVALGIGMCSREAFTAGVVPDPESDVEFPARGWIYRTIFAVAQNGIGAPVIQRQLTLDLRAQRRLDNGRMFLRMVNTDISGTGFDVSMTGIVRALFLLP